MKTSQTICTLFTILFFSIGLLTGIWKYYHIEKSSTASAPEYVNVSHRTALMYSFSTLVLEKLCSLSLLEDRINLVASLVVLIFFFLAVFTYIIHGILNDTDNQLKKPNRLGNLILPNFISRTFMSMLIIAELGGFAVLAYGASLGLFVP